MKIVTWNVNGVRAAAKKGLIDWLDQTDADVVMLQEIKAKPEQLDPGIVAPAGWHAAWNPAAKPGYSGTATSTREKPEGVTLGFGIPRFDAEGRVIVTTLRGIRLFNVYFPNGGSGDDRLAYKLAFYDALLEHLGRLRETAPAIVVAGDFNTAHREIDLARPKENRKTSGFMPIECEALDRWFQAGFTDAFRALHPDQAGAYSWWSMRGGARERNVGWRLDLHLVSPALTDRIRAASIHADVAGSDHCPVMLELADPRPPAGAKRPAAKSRPRRGG